MKLPEMKKLIILFFLFAVTLSASTRMDPHPRPHRVYTNLNGQSWVERHELAVERAQKGEARVMFLGDSITHWWEIEGRGLDSWEKHFVPLGVENLGFGGDRIEHLIWRLENGELGNQQPDVFVLMIGTNNWKIHDAKTIAIGVDRVLAILRNHAPEAKILLHHLLPRGEPDSPQREKVNEVNELLKLLNDEQYIFTVDSAHLFLKKSGAIHKKLMPDSLHPSPRGYREWAEYLKPIIEELLRKTGDDYFAEWKQVKKQGEGVPLFVDPNTHGSCDPEIIFNPWDGHWYIYYTARRPHMQNTFLGTPLGVIRSRDLKDWEFLGYTNLGNGDHRPWTNGTFWAPAIIEHQGRLHMFVTIKDDLIPDRGPWGGYPGSIIHYSTSVDRPVDGWKLEGRMHDRGLTTIDASIFKGKDGFQLWFKGKPKEAKKNELYAMKSRDLRNWEEADFTPSDVFNESVTGSDFEEAPYVFYWKDRYWLITDPHLGLFVYHSEDAEHWKFQGTILRAGGTRPFDGNLARHCSVAVIEDRAFIFYHVEPWRQYESKTPIFKQPLRNRRAVLQMAELKIVDGQLTCDRDQKLVLGD